MPDMLWDERDDAIFRELLNQKVPTNLVPCGSFTQEDFKKIRKCLEGVSDAEKEIQENQKNKAAADRGGFGLLRISGMTSFTIRTSLAHPLIYPKPPCRVVQLS